MIIGANFPKILEEKKIKSKWLYIFAKDNFLKTTKHANIFINQLNNKSRYSEHECIDSYLTNGIFIKVLILWLVTILISPIFIIEIYKITKKIKNF